MTTDKRLVDKIDFSNRGVYSDEELDAISAELQAGFDIMKIKSVDDISFLYHSAARAISGLRIVNAHLEGKIKELRKKL